MRNPNYHQQSDLPSTLSFQRLKNYGQAVGALMATIAEIKN